MQGLHLTADLHNCRCDPAWMQDADKLRVWCLNAVAASGLQPIDQLFHHFVPPEHGRSGITATVLFAGSHLCVHTWPEQKIVTLDVCICGLAGKPSTQARMLMQTLVERFAPQWTEQRALDRGDES